MKIGEEIIKLIKEEKRISASLSEQSNLCTDLGFDSLSFVKLLIKIEEIYSISFELTEMQQCLQTDSLVALVENKVRLCGK